MHREHKEQWTWTKLNFPDDKIWVYEYDPETKQQSSQSSSLRSKKQCIKLGSTWNQYWFVFYITSVIHNLFQRPVEEWAILLWCFEYFKNKLKGNMRNEQPNMIDISWQCTFSFITHYASVFNCYERDCHCLPSLLTWPSLLQLILFPKMKTKFKSN